MASPIKVKANEFTIIPIKSDKGIMGGYRNREDISTLPANTLVVGSRDVLSNTFGRIYSRAGYELDGASSGLNIGIVSSYDWMTPPQGGVKNLRAGGLTTAASGYLEVRNVDSNGNVTWNKILKDLPSVNFNFAPYWNNTQQVSELLMVNGGQQIYDWTGATATVSSTTNSASAIMSIATIPTNGGSDYIAGDVITIAGGGTGATATVNSVKNGVISTLTLSSGGSGYVVSDVISLGQNKGIGASIRVDSLTGSGINAFTLLNGGEHFQTGIAYAQGGSLAAHSPATFTITSINNGSIGVPFDSNAQALTLNTPGTGYSTGSGKATTGGSGHNATVNILETSSNGITIQGTQTIGELGFYLDSNTHRLLINGNSFSYVSSVSNGNGLTFLGVLPDPTTASLTAGDLIIQAPTVTVNSGGSNLPYSTGSDFANWSNDLISVLNNQVYVGCLTNHRVYVSKINSFTDYTYSTPRLPGDGALLIFDAPLVGLIPQENSMYFSCGKGLWYVTQFSLSADVTKESLTVLPLKTGLNQGVFSQALMWKMPNDIAFVTNEPVVRTLGRVDMIFGTPQMVNISAPIVNDMEDYDFTGGSGKFLNENLYISIPTLGIIRIYNMTSQDVGQRNFYWEAPQTIPLSGFMDAGDGNIYGHSALTSDTFKLFTGSSDNGHQINAIAKFPQISFGMRHRSKSFVKEYIEGYISQSTTLTATLNFIGTNKITTLTKDIDGTNTSITVNPMEDASLGKVSLGKNPLGSDLVQSGDISAPNLAVFLTFQRTPFFKVQPVFSSLGTSQSWQLLCIGFNESTTTENEAIITI